MSFDVKLINVHKYYGDIHVLRGVSFEVSKGQVVGLVGPNGAGKTTTFRLIMGILRPDEGKIFVGGVDLTSARVHARKIIGYVPEIPNIYERLTVYENIEFFSMAYGVSANKKKDAIKNIMQLLDIEELKDRIGSKLSKGQLQRVSLACALIHDPQVLILDEPTAGLDPVTSIFIRELIVKIAHEKNKAILLSSHNLYEIEKICDRILVLNDGKILVQGSPEYIKQTLLGNIVEVRLRQPLSRRPEIEGVDIINFEKDKLIFKADDENVINLVITTLVEHGAKIAAVMPASSLEEAYVKLIKKECSFREE